MVLNPFWVGVWATLSVELVLLVLAAIVANIRQNKKHKH